MARKSITRPVSVWIIACILVFLSGGLAVWVWQGPHLAIDSFFSQDVGQLGHKNSETFTDSETFADSVTSKSRKVLVELGIPEEMIKAERIQVNRGSAMKWEVESEVPGDLPLEICNLALTRMVYRMGGKVFEGRQDLNGVNLSMAIGFGDKRTNLITLRQNFNLVRTIGRIAIIIDDIGYQDPELIKKFCALKQRITLSIFPDETRAVWAAKLAVSEGHGVMVHLPMEPIDFPDRDPGPSAIFSDYSEEKIRILTKKALVSIPFARGINNHMGSQVTKNRKAIRSVLKEIQKAELYFIDSVTSPESIAYDMAQDMGIRSGRNTLFLDLKKEPEAVEGALYFLAKEARREGTVIGIGHPKLVTLEALQRVLPKLEKEGIVFIHAGNAVR